MFRKLWIFLVLAAVMGVAVSIPFLEQQRSGAEATSVNTTVIGDEVFWSVNALASDDRRCRAWAPDGEWDTVRASGFTLVRRSTHGYGEQLAWLNVACSDGSLRRFARPVRLGDDARRPVEIMRARVTTKRMKQVIATWSAMALNEALESRVGVTKWTENDGDEYQYQVVEIPEPFEAEDLTVTMGRDGLKVVLEREDAPLEIRGYMRQVNCGDGCYGGEDDHWKGFSDAVVGQSRFDRDRDRFRRSDGTERSVRNVGEVFEFRLTDGTGRVEVELFNDSPRNAGIGVEVRTELDWDYVDSAGGWRPFWRNLFSGFAAKAFAETVLQGEDSVTRQLTNVLFEEIHRLRDEMYPWVVSLLTSNSGLVRRIIDSDAYERYMVDVHVGCGRLLDHGTTIEFSVLRGAVRDCSRRGYEFPPMTIQHTDTAAQAKISYDFLNEVLRLAFEPRASQLLDELIRDAANLEQNTRGRLQEAMRRARVELDEFRRELACMASGRCADDPAMRKAREVLSVLGVELAADLNFHLAVGVRPESRSEVAVFFYGVDLFHPAVREVRRQISTPLAVEGKFGLGGGVRDSARYLVERLSIEPFPRRRAERVDESVLARYQALSGLVLEILSGQGERWTDMMNEESTNSLGTTIEDARSTFERMVDMTDAYLRGRPKIPVADGWTLVLEGVRNDPGEYALVVDLRLVAESG